MTQKPKAFRCASFKVGESGVGFAAVFGGESWQGVFVTVGNDGLPSVVKTPVADHAAGQELSALHAEALAGLADAERRRADENLSKGLSYIGIGQRPANGSLADAGAAALEASAAGRMSREDANRSVQALLTEAIAPVMVAIDQGALRALRAAPAFSRSDFSFYATKDERRGLLRRQAADVYPILAGVMARNLRAKLAIDRAEPLAEALTSALGQRKDCVPVFGKALLRRLQGLEWPLREGIGPEWLGEKLSVIPPEWFPKTPEDWEAFLTVADGLGRNLPQVLGVGFEDLVAGCGGKWKDFLKRIAKAYTDTRPPENLDDAERVEWLRTGGRSPDESPQALKNAAIDLEDMVDAYARLVVLPAAGTASGEDRPYLGEVQKIQARHAAARILLGGKNAAAMFEISRHYHTQAEHILNEATGTEQRKVEFKQVAEDGWAPLCNQVRAPNGVFVIPLTDPRELADEGRHGINEDGTSGLHHCVGSYASSCREHGHHILSFRRYHENGTFERLSTIEIGPAREGQTGFSERQHRGMLNRDVPGDAKQAWSWFQDAVAAGEVPLNYEGIRSYMLASVRNRRDDVERVCGFEWKEEGALDRAIGAWREYVGKGIRGLGATDFCALPEIQEVAEAISPKRVALAAV